MALWIHRIEAILAMCHVFIIHFFIAHLRRHNFPMDRAMFEGSADLSATRHERPAWIARLQEAGELESKLVSEAPAGRRAIFYVFGYAAVVVRNIFTYRRFGQQPITSPGSVTPIVGRVD